VEKHSTCSSATPTAGHKFIASQMLKNFLKTFFKNLPWFLNPDHERWRLF
jgi:hypothetical protein